MISGKDKPFVKGKSFKFPKFERLSDHRKGRPCTKCGRYKKNDQFTNEDEECDKCKENER